MPYHRFVDSGKFTRLAVALGLIMASGASQLASAVEPLKFNRDIRPIFANHCYQCHGPDNQARQGGLRLDQRDQAVAAANSGRQAIVPGDPANSQLLQRILSHEADAAMPPASLNKPLSQRQKELLERWIKEGAIYEPHWSYISVQRPVAPNVTRKDWIRNSIDLFVLSKLESVGRQASTRAELTTLIRRLALDLTGLPPTPCEVDDFQRQMLDAEATDRAAIVATVERVEATYLHWVDHFLNSPHFGERMAVDWLDAARFADSNGYQVDRDREMYAWRDWVIDAFNRNMPFDQFTIEQIAGDLLPNATFSQKIATGFHRNHMLNEEGGIIAEEFLAEYCADRVETTATVWLGQTFNCTRCHDHKFDPFTQKDFYGLYAFFHNVTENGVGNYGSSIRRNAPPFLALPAPEIETQLAALRQSHSEVQQKLAPIDKKLVADQSAWEEQLRRSITDPSEPASAIAIAIPEEISVIVKKELVDRSDAEKKKLDEFYKGMDPERKILADQLAGLTKQINETEGKIPTALIMEELPQPRVTNLLMRGAYDKLGEVVLPNTPATLPAMSAGLPLNRLGLARWLVDPANPLTARVTVNRLWQSLFGIGLVRTSEDFGTQGEPPSHPELLDWLADEFVRSGWDVKHLVRIMVTSATYRQSSLVSSEVREIDPENRLLARGPRFRLQSEFLRDQALAASGLLVTKIGGPSVKPYHPPGLYEQVTAGSGTNKYEEGTGDDLHRRSMYTYWKRSVPNPAMLTFDAPFRESCILRRTRTNTPLQALNLMNDPTYVEAARFLAVRMLTETRPDVASQLDYGFRLILARPPKPSELAILTAAYHRWQHDFSADVNSAKELLQIGKRKSPEHLNSVQLASLTIVASTILNFDEAVMKE